MKKTNSSKKIKNRATQVKQKKHASERTKFSDEDVERLTEEELQPEIDRMENDRLLSQIDFDALYNGTIKK